MNLLITGFGRFPGAPFNPSGDLVRALQRRRRPALAGANVATHVFRTAYGSVDRDLPELLSRHRPDILVMFGLAGRTRHLRIEILARNRLSLLFPDADGKVPPRAKIRSGAEPCLRGSAPWQALLSSARVRGIDARLSRDAGRYLCNYLYWRAIEAARQAGGPRLVVFVHIPNVRRCARRKATRRTMDIPKLACAAEGLLLAAISGARRR